MHNAFFENYKNNMHADKLVDTDLAHRQYDEDAFSRTVNVEDSDSVSILIYAPKFSILRVRFTNGVWYEYYGVNAFTFGRICGSESVGKAFHERIISNEDIPYSKMENVLW